MCRTPKNPLGLGHPDAPRRLIAVDVENVIGGAARTIDEATWAMRVVDSMFHLAPTDHVVLGACHYDALAVGLAWQPVHARLLPPRSGQDGADLALLEVLDGEQVDQRYDQLVLISGDGIFADSVSRLTGTGMEVVAAAHRGGFSRRLQAAASRSVFLTDFGLAA